MKSALECERLKAALDVMGDRWSAVILWGVKDGPQRFGDIQSAAGVNSRTLTQRLQTLEGFGLITRQEFKEYPPRTEYTITPKGADLLKVIDLMVGWAEKYRSKKESNKKG